MLPMFRRGPVALARLLCTATIVLPVLLPAQPLSAQQALPARLSDQDFWKLMVDMSEPGGVFQSENYLSNEIGFQHPIPELMKTVKPGGVYVGVGPEQNFTYISALQPHMVFICDIRRGNTMGQLIYKALFEMSTDRADFLSKLFSRPRPAGLDSTSSAAALFQAYTAVPADSMMYYRTLAAIKDRLVKQHGFALSAGDLANLETIFDVFYWGGTGLSYSFGNNNGFGGGGRGMPTYSQLMGQDDGAGVQRSYLATEANWRVLRDLEQKNLIVPVVGNFGGPKALRAVGAYVKDHGAIISTFYTSNVEQYLFMQGINTNFYENVATFPIDSTSQFIRSGRRNGFGGGGGGAGGLSESLIAPIMEIVRAYRDGTLYDWQSVLALSH